MPGHAKGRFRIVRKGGYGRYKSRTLRRVFVRTPSRTELRYKERKPSKQKCARCGKPLHGVLRERAFKMKKISKSKKRPSRPFGGYLCSKCMREEIKARVRK